jgi:gliding motility-associated-like protein
MLYKTVKRNKFSFFALLLFSFIHFQLFAGDGDPLTRSSTAIILSINSTGTTCGRSNGSIIVTATGGTAPYSYQLNSNTPQNSNIFLYLAAGTYTIAVTDATGQTATGNVTLTNIFTPPTGVTAQVTSQTTGCTTQDASLTLTGFGGTPPYTYSIDHTNFQTSNVFSNLSAGLYHCAVKDANGCESFYDWQGYTLIPEHCPIIQNGVGSSYSCNPFQSHLTLENVSGGTAPYQYSLDGINFQLSKDFYPLPAGLYTVTVKDAAGTIMLYSVALHDACISPITFNGTVMSAQCGQNGSITVTPLDGTSPYSYSIDGINFQTSNQFSGLTPGNYTITVKDANNLISSKLFIVGNGCLSLTTIAVSSTCGNSNGSIQVQASSGNPPYQYSINGINFTTNNQFTNLLAGPYTITVKDATGGITTVNATVNNIPGPVISSLVATPAGCINSNGTITLTTQGGTAPLQYSINSTVFQSNASFAGLPGGSYTAIAKDANGCTVSGTIVVPLNNTVTVNAGSNVSICEGQTIKLSAISNGNSFLWSPATGLSNTTILTPDASPADTIIYTLTATAGVCTATGSVTVFVNSAPVANAGSDTTICFGKNVQLTGSGGIIYSWSPSTWLNSPTIPDPVVTSPPVGSYAYSLTVKDNNGCSSLLPATIRINVFSPVVFAGRDTAIVIYQPLQLQAIDPNNSGFSMYNWSPTTGLNNPAIANPVAAIDIDMTYTVTAQTPGGCIATDNIALKVYKTADIFVPTAFTPNHDGLNDILKAISVGIREFKGLHVYNRWGQLVFQTVNEARGWDGMFNGTLQNGVFVWRAEGTDYNGNIIKRKGTVLVIR